MPWWGWVLVWLGLFLFAGAVFTALGLSLWRRGKLLFHEVGEAGDRVSAVSDQIQQLSRRAQEAQDPAVFDSPSQLRQERVRSRAGRRGF
jgi:hypothetical protein